MEEHSIFLITKSIEAYCHYDEIRSNRRDGSLTVALQEKQAKKLVEKMKELADHTRSRFPGTREGTNPKLS